MADDDQQPAEEPAAGGPVRAAARRVKEKTGAVQRKAADKVDDARTATTDALRDGFDKVIESIDDLGHRDK